ncbi:CNH domain-containing protein [Flagelloscypha sp. PMI_526]|nr:CNH domain-containing protein [Flagelloscypha sp. PMI_526]
MATQPAVDNLDTLYSTVWNGYVRREPDPTPPTVPMSAPIPLMVSRQASISTRRSMGVVEEEGSRSSGAAGVANYTSSLDGSSSHHVRRHDSVNSTSRRMSTQLRGPRPLPRTPGSAPANAGSFSLSRSSSMSSRVLPSTPPTPAPSDLPPPSYTSPPPSPPAAPPRASVGARPMSLNAPLNGIHTRKSSNPTPFMAVAEEEPGPFDAWQWQYHRASGVPASPQPGSSNGNGTSNGNSSVQNGDHINGSQLRTPPPPTTPPPPPPKENPTLIPRANTVSPPPPPTLLPPPPPPPEVRRTIEGLKRTNSYAPSIISYAYGGIAPPSPERPPVSLPPEDSYTSQQPVYTPPTNYANHSYNSLSDSSSSPASSGRPASGQSQPTRAPLNRNPSDTLTAIRDYNYHDSRDEFLPLDNSTHMDDILDTIDWPDTYSDGADDDPNRFINHALLSHLAVQLKDKVVRQTHVKGSIPYPKAFTGKDIVSTLQSLIQRELATTHGISTSDRAIAVQAARSLQSQLFFMEVEWGGGVLQDGVEDVFMFPDESDFGIDGPGGLPNGVITTLTKCYSATCAEDDPCYSGVCPRRKRPPPTSNEMVYEPPPKPIVDSWSANVPREVLQRLPPAEVNRQTIIHKLISKEQAYLHDLDLIESAFMKPLIHACQNGRRQSLPRRSSSLPMGHNSQQPIIPPSKLSEFIDTVFSNILDLRECNRREQNPVIERVGDIFLGAAVEFRVSYVEYLGNLGRARDCSWSVGGGPSSLQYSNSTATMSSSSGGPVRIDLLHYLNRPLEHLSRYPFMLQAVLSSTAEGNPDEEFLVEAIAAFKTIEEVARLRQWQRGYPKKQAHEEGGSGPRTSREGRPEIQSWVDLLDKDRDLMGVSDSEKKRQAQIFELIQGEMAYVADLQSIEGMYVEPLRNADSPIIDPKLLEPFIHDVFHNYRDLLHHHSRLLDKLQQIQRDEYPFIHSITAPIMDAVLNFRDAYLEYVPNYPIAAYKIDEEMRNNPMFDAFVNQCVRHPNAHRLDMKNFVNRPIPRLLRYELLLKGIMDHTPKSHPDHNDIPSLLDQIKDLGKSTEPGVVSSKTKVQLWTYNSNIVFKAGESWIDMDLLNEQRSLIWTGKLLRQPDRGLELNGWSELFVLLFDNYLVMTKTRQKDGVVQYHVNRRPIPLDLLTLVNFSDMPTQRGQGLLRPFTRGDRHNRTTVYQDAPLSPPATGIPPSLAVSSSSTEPAADSRLVYPCTIHYTDKLEEALGLRRVVQETNKVIDTFVVPSAPNGAGGGGVGPGGVIQQPSWDPSYTGQGYLLSTSDGRELVAIGCAEGVWIGFKHDSRSMRRVLHLKMVTQCAMLEDFGLFLVLADKSLFAYHIEALVPSAPNSPHASQTPQKLSGTKDVHFFSVGNLHGRTLIMYMKRKNTESIFHVLEPVLEKINEGPKLQQGIGSHFLKLKANRSEWFRSYKDFFVPGEAYDIFFLKNKIAIMCTKGFEIMDLHDYSCVTIPQTQDPRMEKIIKRCEENKSLGLFRSGEDEFLLCYRDFGLYVNKHGDPSRDHGTIEWEGSATSVALHKPYILLFSYRFIEIRHLETGRLSQIITGDDVHCLWDGRNVSGARALASPEGLSQDPRVHAAMNNPLSSQSGNRGAARGTVAQHVFEMIPTVPLFNPETYSPPRSPP